MEGRQRRLEIRRLEAQHERMVPAAESGVPENFLISSDLLSYVGSSNNAMVDPVNSPESREVSHALVWTTTRA